MATSRKRSSGFEKSSDEKVLENPANFEEMLESVKEIIEAEDEAEPPVIAPTPFVEETIVPTADLGPRFLEEPAPVKPGPKKLPELKPPPKRQPRNVPRFSRIR